eukprot:37134-Pleurochrysis_carterae.AAC.1
MTGSRLQLILGRAWDTLLGDLKIGLPVLRAITVTFALLTKCRKTLTGTQKVSGVLADRALHI